MAEAHVLNDFPDRLTPMLVKELRQGMRAKTFVSLFLALQVFLLLILLISFSAAGATSNDAGTTLSGIVFLFYALAVLVVQPLRGMGALSSEIKGNTIDMMVLTRLDSWRIVGGKWFALVAQSALILVATMPYLVLRYFFGGMNLFAELNLLFTLFIVSGGLCAFTVGLSAAGTLIARLIPILATPFLVSAIFTGLNSRAMKELLEFLTLDTDKTRYALLSIILMTVYIAWLSLSVGASQIAPISENHATRRRLIGLATTLAISVLAVLAEFDEAAFIILLLAVVSPLIIITLGEGQQLIPRHCQPFVKRGLLGRIAGRFLYPGWVSGVPYVLLLIAITAACFFWYHEEVHNFDTDAILVSLCIINSLVFPRVLMIGWINKVKNVLPMYLMLGVSSGVVSLILFAIAESMNADMLKAVFSWIPMMNMFWGSEYGHRDAATTAAIIYGAVYIGLLFLTAVLRFHKLRSIEADAAA